MKILVGVLKVGKYYAPVRIPGYEDLVAKPPEPQPKEKHVLCHTCNVNPRRRLKSGEYDSYCVECRSVKNKIYGDERRAKLNRYFK